MTGQKQKPGGNAILRMVFVAVALLFQVGWILLLILVLNEYSATISAVTGILSAIVVLKLYSKQTNAAMKMPWILLILLFPVMGLSLYLMFELLGDPGISRRMSAVRQQLSSGLTQDAGILERLEKEDRSAANQFRYLWGSAGYPVYGNTKTRYFAEGTDAFAAMKQDLERAEKYIFMEYFIVEDRSSFRELQEILIRKHK